MGLEQLLLYLAKGDTFPFLFLIVKKEQLSFQENTKVIRLITKNDDFTAFIKEKQMALKQMVWTEK